MAAAAAPLALSFVWRDCDCKWAAPSKCAGKAPPKADRSVTIGCWVACCKQLREQQKEQQQQQQEEQRLAAIAAAAPSRVRAPPTAHRPPPAAIARARA
jgi:hypothetical protein